eukprot:10890752-Alexandrium_andersonii.AAC.1
MSASLVGSEMCIRDRLGAPAASPWPARLVDAGGPPYAEAHLASEPPSGAVSYTHLTLPTICSV